MILLIKSFLAFTFSMLIGHDKNYISKPHISILPNKSLLIKQDSIKKEPKERNSNTPPIITLPFGKKIYGHKLYKGDYYGKLIYEDLYKLSNEGGFTPATSKNIKTYKLPVIKSVTYIGISPEEQYCKNGKSFGNYIKLARYRYKLPDFHSFKCYYVCDFDPNIKSYNDWVKENCFTFMSETFGYLLLYDPAKLHAIVLPVFFNRFGGDTLSFGRLFFIDTDYKITLIDYEIDEESTAFIAKYEIALSTIGSIKVRKTN